VALAIAHRRRDVRVIAIDASREALRVATENAQQLGLPVEFLHGDLLAPLAPGTRAEVIVANLPYIPTADIAGLSPEVRSEPLSALDGGPDGLDIVRRLVAAAPATLRPGGALALEIGDGQAAAVEMLLQKAGFVDVRSAQDLAQIPRIVHGRFGGALGKI
jgi:release factor glutamine methyltransferase